MGALASRSYLQKRAWNLAPRPRTEFGQDDQDLQDRAKAAEAGKAGISPGTSTVRFWSNRLGFGVGITEPTTYAYNAAANKVPERGRPRPLTSFE